MRTSILTAAILGLFAVGCAGELSGTGDDTGGDDVQPGICGDGALNSGETCDDGNTTPGDGCSSSCVNEPAVPRVQVSMDKTTLSTDLLVDNEIDLTLTAMNGFVGDVTLASTVVDANGTAINGWTAALATTTVTLVADGMGTAKMKVRIPGDTNPLTGTVKVTATSSAATQEASLTVNATNKVVITYMTNGNGCVYPADFSLANPIRVKVDRVFSVVNGSDPAGTGCGGQPCRMQIHFDGGTTGINHQGAPMAAGTAYNQTPTGVNPTGVTFYCHNAGQADTAVEASAQNTRQRLITVN